MGLISSTLMLTIFFFLWFFVLSSSARDSIVQGSWLRDDGSRLVSADGTFELGFFIPPGSPLKEFGGRYVGIWYSELKEKVVVWVAKRVAINGRNARFGIAEDGSLMIWGNNRPVYLYPGDDRDKSPSASKVVKLMNSGNLVFSDSRTGEIIWESFHDPTDTFLPGMKMDDKLTLASWLSPINPAAGTYIFKLEQENQNQYNIMLVDSYAPYWNSKDSERTPDEMTHAILSLLANSTVAGEPKRYGERLVMTSSGQIQYYMNRSTSPAWWAPRDRCSVSNACGRSGSCNANNAFMCKCLPGFKPDSQESWSTGDFSSGCTRESSLLCENKSNHHTFLSLKMMKVQPLGVIASNRNDSCREACLNDCRCRAYAETHIKPGNGTMKCFIWTEDPKTLQEEYDHEFFELFVRVPVSDIEPTARNCETCGSNMIPYPLSTGPKCGDPMYSNFECNTSTGQVLFKGPGGSYRVTKINPETLTFVIQLKVAEKKGSNCSSPSFVAQIPGLNPPFHSLCNASNVSKTNNYVSNMALENTAEVEISWDPPPEPWCNSSEDCNDWPNSSCTTRQYKGRRCFCNKNFQWNGQFSNCTKEHGKKVSLAIVIGIPVAVAVVAILGTIGFIAYLHKRTITKSKGKMTNQGHHLNYSDSRVKHLVDSEQFEEEDKKGIDVPFFDLEGILAATDNFSDANKLGEGGFGPVYKGKFLGGQEMAIKRLSRGSRQGLQEYKNEVVLIAKLQHRNLVRLLGYCIERDEKILLYEYLPNKSLDSFIFDPTPCMLLNWEKRFDIILGIARGLLYLHQDSRLKIIHRDLKTSNILLDNEMNPKISDFGLARIFDSKQVEASTNRVVGTYGYMSPEYALDGYFSEKSDVFSFGVMVLEIISGKRNTRIYHSDQALSLLGYAWKLWKENNVLELMDQALNEICNTDEFMRCVNVGLLCVQDDPIDRPTMGMALVMLSSDIARMPVPKQPAFVVKRDLSSTASSSSKPEASWKSEILVSIEEGR